MIGGAGFFAGLLLLGAISEGSATPAGDALGTAREAIVVTANRVEQELGEVAAHVTVFTREEIARSSARTLDDFLRRVAGFSLFRRSSSQVAHPTTQGASLRGVAPSGVGRTLVLVDGVPANDPFGGWVYWSRLPVDRIESVQIQRGGGSSAWGNQALAGVIHVTTRPIEPRATLLGLEVGDRDELELDAFASRRRGAIGWSIEGHLADGDGYPIVREDQRGPIDRPAFSRRSHIAQSFAFDLSSRDRLVTRVGYFDEKRGNGTPLTDNETQAIEFQATHRRLGAGGGWLDLQLFGRDQTFANRFSAQETDRSSEQPALDQVVSAHMLGGGAQWTRHLGSSRTVTVGGDLQWVDGQTRELFLWGGDSFRRERLAGGDQRYLGAFVQHLVTLGDDTRLELGGRLDTWWNRAGFRREADRASGPLRDDAFEDRRDFAFSPRVGVLRAVTRQLAVRATAYSSFRAPTLNELYRPFRVRNDVTEANAALGAEQLLGAELGADYSRSNGEMRATLFWNRIESPIVNVTMGLAEDAGVIAPCGFLPAGGSCRQRDNLGAMRVRGAELELELRPSTDWRLSCSYLYSQALVIDGAGRPELEGRRLSQVPAHQATLGLRWAGARGLRLEGTTRMLGEQFEDDQNTRRLGGFVVFDLGISKELSSAVTFSLAVENLFDRTYPVGVSGDGLTTVAAPASVRLRVRWANRTANSETTGGGARN